MNEITPAVQTCSNCLYITEDLKSTREEKPVKRCRRYPRRIVSMVGSTASLHPITRPDDWCGEWKGTE